MLAIGTEVGVTPRAERSPCSKFGGKFDAVGDVKVTELGLKRPIWETTPPRTSPIRSLGFLLDKVGETVKTVGVVEVKMPLLIPRPESKLPNRSPGTEVRVGIEEEIEIEELSNAVVEDGVELNLKAESKPSNKPRAWFVFAVARLLVAVKLIGALLARGRHVGHSPLSKSKLRSRFTSGADLALEHDGRVHNPSSRPKLIPKSIKGLFDLVLVMKVVASFGDVDSVVSNVGISTGVLGTLIPCTGKRLVRKLPGLLVCVGVGFKLGLIRPSHEFNSKSLSIFGVPVNGSEICELGRFMMDGRLEECISAGKERGCVGKAEMMGLVVLRIWLSPNTENKLSIGFPIKLVGCKSEGE